MTEPQLLRVPCHFHSVGEALATAQRLDLPNVLILSELPDGKLVFLDAVDLTVSQANWLLDRAKFFLQAPAYHERVGP